jgi:hypothetical protein
MANVHGLFSNRGKRDDDNDDDDDEANNRYVGGIGARGGGRYDAHMYMQYAHVTWYFTSYKCLATFSRILLTTFVSNCSGLAVVPNPNELGGSGGSGSTQRDMVFGLAQEASGGDGEGSEEQVRRTITMVAYFLFVFCYLTQQPDYKLQVSYHQHCSVFLFSIKMVLSLMMVLTVG